MSYTGREQQKLWLVSFSSSVKKERSYNWFNVQWINIHFIHLNFKISKQHHKEYYKFIKELDIFYVQCTCTRILLFMSPILKFWKNFPVWDNEVWQQQFLPQIFSFNVYFLKEELICLFFFAIDLDLGNRCDRWSWTGSDPVHCAAGGAGPPSYEWPERGGQINGHRLLRLTHPLDATRGWYKL